MHHSYPVELAAAAWARWEQLEVLADPGPCSVRPGAMPRAAALEQLLSIAYQASLLREEDRPVRFRLFVGDPARLELDEGPPEGLHTLRFTRPRPYDEQEIRRLAAAAKYHRALIGVEPTGETGFQIWGILQSGPRWLPSARSGRALPSPGPNDVVVVRVSGPGLVSIGLGDVTLGELRAGQLQQLALDTFDAAWLSTRFSALRSELREEHMRDVGRTAGVALEPNVIRKISQQMFKRVIAILREAHHGGTLLIVPEAHAATLLGDGGALRLKYAFADGEPRRRHRTLIRRILRELALAATDTDPHSTSAGWSIYQESARPSIAALDEASLEVSQLLAALGDVDGAVVLTDRLELLGFGAEITGPLPEIDTVRRALDLEASVWEIVAIDSVGTRHRSAYRLCAHERDALAIVVSQDGAVQFVAWHGGLTTYWDHLPSLGSDP
jgi:hypothetical protein